MRAMLFALLVLLAAPNGALAEEYKDGDALAPPPQRFLGPYTKGPIISYEAPHERIWQLCYDLFTKHNKIELRNNMWPPGEQLGCAVPEEDKCTLVFGISDHETYTHEYAHCNGWSERHER